MADLLEYYETLVDGNINLLEPEEMDLIRSERDYIQDKVCFEMGVLYGILIN